MCALLFGGHAHAQDELTVIIEPTTTEVTEGESAVFTLTLSSGAPEGGLTVVVDIAESDFIFGQNADAPRSVQFGAGAHVATLRVNTFDDTLDEPDGSVTATVRPLSLVGGRRYGAGTPGSASVLVKDNDDPPRIVWSGGGFVETAANDGSVTGSVTATLTGTRFHKNVQFYFASQPTNVPAGLVAIFTPIYTVESRTTFIDDRTRTRYISGVTLTLTGKATEHDDVDDVSDLSVTFTNTAFVGGNAGAVTGATKTDLVIDFNDPYPPTVTIDPKTTPVREGTAAEYTLILSSAAPLGGLTVNVSVADAAGSDFVAADDEGTRTVTVAGGETEAIFSVSTVADTVDEPDGYVIATVRSPSLLSDRSYRAGTPGSAAVLVLNSDDPQPPAPQVTPPVESPSPVTSSSPVTSPSPATNNNPGDGPSTGGGGGPSPTEETEDEPSPTEEVEEECDVSGVTDDESLKKFVECAAGRIEASEDSEDTLALLEEWRNDKKWNDGERYLVLLTAGGEVHFHANDGEAEELDWSGILFCEEGESVLDTEEGCFIEYEGERNGYAHPLSASHVPEASGEEEFVLLGGFDGTPDGDTKGEVIEESSTQTGNAEQSGESDGGGGCAVGGSGGGASGLSVAALALLLAVLLKRRRPAENRTR